MKNEAKLGSGPIDFVEMAGQMARKCEEVFEKRAHSPVENNDVAICSHLPVPKVDPGWDRALFADCRVAEA